MAYNKKLSETLEKMNYIADEIKKRRVKLLELRAEYEDHMQLLRVYKRRGHISAEEVKKYADKIKPEMKLSESIKEYRKHKKQK